LNRNMGSLQAEKGAKNSHHPNSAANMDASIFTESERKALIAVENGSFLPQNFTVQPQARRMPATQAVSMPANQAVSMPANQAVSMPANQAVSMPANQAVSMPATQGVSFENPFQIGIRQHQPRAENLSNLRIGHMEVPLPSLVQAEFPQLAPPTPNSNSSSYNYMISSNMNSFAQALQDMDKPFQPDDMGLSQEDKIRLFEAPSNHTGDGTSQDCYLPSTCNLGLNGMMNDNLQPFSSHCRTDTNQAYDMMSQGGALVTPQAGAMNDASVPYAMDQYYFLPPSNSMPQDPLGQRNMFMNQQQRF